MLGCTRLFIPKPPRRLGESLARPLRARGRPARTKRVWAADAMGCYDRDRALALAFLSVACLRVLALHSAQREGGSAISSLSIHLSSLIIHHSLATLPVRGMAAEDILFDKT